MTPNERDNLTRWRPDQDGGHVESYFAKGNSPDQRRAFWLKFTLLSPRGRPQATIADVWAIVFDRQTGEHVAVKESYPVATVTLARDQAELRFGESELRPGYSRGQVSKGSDTIAWDLKFTIASAPLHPLPLEIMYRAPLPKFKLVSPYPDEVFDGTLEVNGETIAVASWSGMQGHNWGTEHTHRYAWVHCNVFDEPRPDTFFEGFSGKVKLGPIVTPWLTVLCLRLEGRRIYFRGLRDLLNPNVSTTETRWHFAARNDQWDLNGEFSCGKQDMVGLYYANPYGSSTHCLNSKTARGDLVLRNRSTGEVTRLASESAAALEIVTPDINHGVRMYA